MKVKIVALTYCHCGQRIPNAYESNPPNNVNDLENVLRTFRRMKERNELLKSQLDGLTQYHQKNCETTMFWCINCQTKYDWQELLVERELTCKNINWISPPTSYMYGSRGILE